MDLGAFEIDDRMSQAIAQAVRSAVFASLERGTLEAAPPPRERLSEREREVLQHIAAGDSNKLIARALGLSPHTVKRHVANILDKLNARTRAQAAARLPGNMSFQPSFPSSRRISRP